MKIKVIVNGREAKETTLRAGDVVTERAFTPAGNAVVKILRGASAKRYAKKAHLRAVRSVEKKARKAVRRG